MQRGQAIIEPYIGIKSMADQRQQAANAVVSDGNNYRMPVFCGVCTTAPFEEQIAHSIFPPLLGS